MATLTNGIVSLTGITTKADRTVCDEQVTYKPRGKYWDSEDVNQVVYDLMTIAAQDALGRGTVLFGGDFTAAEMAGTLNGVRQFTVCDDFNKTIRIETDTFCCSYGTSSAFYQMADWEGVMSLSSKNYRRFHCEGRELPKGEKILPLIRRSYKPKQVSVAADNARIAKKFEVLGAMARSLTSEGMRKALSVLTAIGSIKKMHGYDMADLADRMLRRKLWREYGRDKNQQPMVYCASDFQHGPEVWKKVDEVYVKELMDHFRKVMDENPAPEWPKKGDVVMLKGQEKQCKKWQGKLGVYRVYGSLDLYKDRIEWYAEVHTTKGKYDCMNRCVDCLEPVPDEQEGKVAKKTKAEKKADVRSKKADTSPQTSVVSPQASNTLSLAERLRMAMLERIAA